MTRYVNILAQADVLEAIAGIDLTVHGAPSIVLCDLSEYSTLAFVAAFDVQTPGAPTDSTKAPKKITYIALCKKTMPLIVKMYLDFKDQPLLYQDGTLEAILSVSLTCVPWNHTLINWFRHTQYRSSSSTSAPHRQSLGRTRRFGKPLRSASLASPKSVPLGLGNYKVCEVGLW